MDERSITDDYIAMLDDKDLHLAVVMVVLAAQLWHTAPVSGTKIELLHAAVRYLDELTKHKRQ